MTNEERLEIELAIFGVVEAYNDYDEYTEKMIRILVNINIAVEDEEYEYAAQLIKDLEMITQTYSIYISNRIPFSKKEVLEVLKTITEEVRNNIEDDK